MKRIIEFLTQLKENNNKTWFDAHKQEYKAIDKEFQTITQQLIDGIAKFDQSVTGVTVKDCTYRIYRDVRFSHDKSPYKTYIGAYVCPKGKKSGYSGYYFHLEPENSLLAVGLHCPDPKVLQSVREDIEDRGVEFEAAIKKASKFHLDESQKLKNVPKGFSKESPYAEYLKLKDIDLIQSISIEDSNLLNDVLEQFEQAYTFNKFLNRAVDYFFNEE